MTVRIFGENFSGRGDFPLGANMGSDSISPKLLGESIFFFFFFFLRSPAVALGLTTFG